MSAEFSPTDTVIESGPFMSEEGRAFIRRYIIREDLNMFEGGVLVEDRDFSPESTPPEL